MSPELCQSRGFYHFTFPKICSISFGFFYWIQHFLSINHFKYLIRWATEPGPYQSPAFFPVLSPNWTRDLIENGLLGAAEVSPNHLTIFLCFLSVSNHACVSGSPGIHRQSEYKNSEISRMSPSIYEFFSFFFFIARKTAPQDRDLFFEWLY